MAAVYESVLDAIGGTPLIRLARLAADLPVPVYAKVEFLNPGGSVKDRAALAMVTAAEESGQLGPGGTIVEGTSGNTGTGLAMVAARRGYRMVAVVPDKTSREKVVTLRAYGAEVVVTSGSVPRQHPDHVQAIAARIAAETPGALFVNQYDNPANPRTHQDTTGPEIWTQTEGLVSHFVAGIGTGGTITGTGRYLKQASAGRVRVIGADPFQSVYAGGDGSPYYVEAVGHYLHPETEQDVWPETYDTTVVDAFERIGDRESLLTARRLAREEGLLVGGSAGTAVAAALRVAATLSPPDLVVVLMPDSGRSYLTKYADDDWLCRFGFLAEPGEGRTVGSVMGPAGVALPVDLDLGAALELAAGPPAAGDLRPVVLRRRTETAEPALGETLGAVSLTDLRARVAAGGAGESLTTLLSAPLPAVGVDERAASAAGRIEPGASAWVLRDGRVAGVVTRDALTG